MDRAGYPQAWEADVLLRDGHPVHLRPITPDDGAALREFHARLSPRSVYFRFFSAKPALTDADVAYFTGVDHVTRVALVALDRDRIIGVGRFDVVGGGSAEVAFLIRDDVQGLGLGSILLEHLAAAARDRGVHRFVAEVLPENSRMLATFREAGYEVTHRREQDVIAVAFDIEPTETSLAVMAAREHRAEARSMARMLRPASVAVVGASRRSGGLGHAVLRHLVEGGFRGSLVAVHPEVAEIDGVPCVRSMTEAGHPIDLAVVIVPAGDVPAVLADASAAGVHGLVVVSGGFGDSGPEGLRLQARLVADAHRTGMRVVGPNALGIINTDADVRLNASLVPRMPRPGRAGFFCQSGALAISVLDRLATRGLGVSSVVSAGNRADVSGNDLLQYWEEDPATSTVLLHLETIGNPRKFARLVRRIARTKPVVMVRTGGSRPRHPLGHAVTHSGLSQRAVDQILADCGLVVVESVDRLIDAGLVMGGQPLPATSSVAIVSNSDALSALAENAILARGLAVAGEPVAFARRESADAYEEALTRLAHDPTVGAVLAVYVPPSEVQDDVGIRTVLRACRGCGADRHAPVVAVLARPAAPGPDEDVPVFADVEDAVGAVAMAYGLRRWRAEDDRRVAEVAPAWPGDGTLDAGDGQHSGVVAARIVQDSVGVEILVDPEGTGLRVRLEDDPAFGTVVSVGLDDAVAEILGDREYRLAPVTVSGAVGMLRSLGALPVLVREQDDPDGAGETVAALAEAISAVSHLHLQSPRVRAVEFRQLSRSAEGDLTAADIVATVGPIAVEADPAVRRL